MPEISEEVELALKVVLRLGPYIDGERACAVRPNVFLRNFAFVDEEFGHELMTISITKLGLLPKLHAKLWAAEEKDAKEICFKLGLWANQLTHDWAYGAAK